MKIIVLIDLSSIAHKHWHTSSGDPDPDATSNRTIAEVYALSAGQPHVAICCDSGKSWRADVDPTYKANRPEREEALTHQIRLAEERLKADGFPVWKERGFEADDLIATAAMGFGYGPFDVLIATADKDLLQLVGDATKDKPLIQCKSIRNGDVLDEDAVVAKLGVKPSQVRDYLCLVGDTSDNITGAKGIGPKTAVDLLTRYGTIDEMYQHLDDPGAFKPGQLASLQEFAKRLDTVRQLVSLRYDAPIDFQQVLKERESPKMEDEPMDSTEQATTAPDAPEVATNGETTAPLTTESAALVRAIQGEVVPWEKGLEPRTMDQAKELSKWVHDSRQFIGSLANPQAALMTILAGRELGLQAMASLRAIHIIEGKPTLSADLIRALVIKSGLAQYFRCTERTNERATFETQRGDDPAFSLTFTIAEAQAAGLVKPKSGWEKNPADMLVARASAKLARLVYPDVVHGIYTPEELEDR